MKQLFILLAILLIASCGSPKTAGIGEVLRPDPTTGLPYPIYDNFDAIEPLFNQQNDTTYIVNFWATWCKPCVEELPHFQELNEKYAGQPLRIVLVSLDFKKDVHTKLLSFIEERQLELPVVALTDGNQAGWIDRVDNSWGGAIPVTVIYKNGLRHFVNEQFDTYYDLEALVKPLI